MEKLVSVQSVERIGRALCSLPKTDCELHSGCQWRNIYYELDCGRVWDE